MEEELLHVSKCLQSFPKLPLWIIEHVWAHKIMDIQEVMISSKWPEMDYQLLNLEDPWRLRVSSAQVYSIMMSRDVEQFEKVIQFLDATYILLPQLVSPIKHVKIVFGLKTMVIVQMLRKGSCVVDTIFKINQFFQSKLPQYQDKCSQREMFLMRKNHQEFKTFAQELAMDKDKLKDYLKDQMEEQYGELYAQKVEDRLLHYLHMLEAMLPGDTCIDKILKKQSPMTEEERLLVQVVTSDSRTIATTLKKLLHCDVASCCPGRMFSTLESRKSQVDISQTTNSVPLRGSLHETEQEVSVDRHLHQQTVEAQECLRKAKGKSRDKKKAQRGSEAVQTAPSSPQFCSRHQRWVKSILQGCPDECSEELRLQANASVSPTLFQSSSSGSSSGDLTPSGLIPLPSEQQHPTSQTSTHTQTAAGAFGQTKSGDKQISRLMSSSGSDPQPVPAITKTLLPHKPVVRLVDIASIPGLLSIFNCQKDSPNANLKAASASSPSMLTCEDVAVSQETIKGSVSEAPRNYPCLAHEVELDSVTQDLQPPTQQQSSRPLRKRRLISSSNIYPDSQAQGRVKRTPPVETTFRNSCPLLPVRFNNSKSPTHDPSLTGTLSSSSSANLTQTPRSVSIHHITPSLTVSSSSVGSNCCRVQTPSLRLSLRSQMVLLQSKLLQPFVSVVRISRQECEGGTVRRSSPIHEEPAVLPSSSESSSNSRMEEGEDEDSSFDVNTLYSSFSSSSDGETPLHGDPDYRPWIKKKTLVQEYESARIMNREGN